MRRNRYRAGYVVTVEEGAELSFSISRTGRWTVHCAPSPTAIDIASQRDHEFSLPTGPILLVEGDPKNDLVVTYPLNTTATSRGFF
jgi:hypothetical protein